MKGAPSSDPDSRLRVSLIPFGRWTPLNRRPTDLLVLDGFSIERQQEIAGAFQVHRRWRAIPVLYVLPPGNGGLVIPSCYRPELDGIVRGTFGESAVESRIRELAREGAGIANVVVAGPFELDTYRGRLSCEDAALELTSREAEIMAMLMDRVESTVSAAEIIERSWGTLPDARHLQILRRHVSNIRRKLENLSARAELATERGLGYRFTHRSA
ncbi:MAG: winged helix-turn-helix domain-containing protein [Dehalococcoidia bacterium]|nr:winged helix-turn-helix domain-containing protein [Dehalococcoidia bacterium]